jgi:hypothetical protein
MTRKILSFLKGNGGIIIKLVAERFVEIGGSTSLFHSSGGFKFLKGGDQAEFEISQGPKALVQPIYGYSPKEQTGRFYPTSMISVTLC